MTHTDRPWPRVRWDQRSLELTAQAVRLTNPYVVYDSDESCESIIRGMAERELYRLGHVEHGTLVSTGGWQVVFVAGDRPNEFSAWPSLTPYSVIRYAKEA
jgi:hypothetical protein